MKYCRLKNSEILLAKNYFFPITWKPDFYQACGFRRMSMNDKNFRFTQTPDKNSDVVFLKSLKTLLIFGLFLIIFGHFCLIGVFSNKSSSFTHAYIWVSNTMLTFHANLRTDGRTGGSLFREPFLPRPVVQTCLKCNWVRKMHY